MPAQPPVACRGSSHCYPVVLACAGSVLSLEFLRTFAATGLSAGSIPMVGHHWADALGVVIFNFAFCVTVPSWLNEKAHHVNVNYVVRRSMQPPSALSAVARCFARRGSCYRHPAASAVRAARSAAPLARPARHPVELRSR